jgi:hypothetical protein
MAETAPSSQTAHTEVNSAVDGGPPEGTDPGAETPENEGLKAKILASMELADGEDTFREPDLIGKLVADRFEVVERVGEGGMGVVYRARQRGMDRDVAIKVLHRAMTANLTVVRRFKLEALAVSKLRHPNTIQIFDFGTTDDEQLYLAMEFLQGVSLHRLLSKERVLPVERALRIAGQIGKSLREAHAKGIVHRDLKPDNIFLTVVGEEADFVKVLDFGVAKLREGDKAEGTLTKAGSIFGTPRYMSPEQSVSASVDARSDLYAIGVILYEMLMGRVPFDGDNTLGILIQHVQEPPSPFRVVRPDLVVPSDVELLVMRLLAKTPEQRPQSAEALVRDLEELGKRLDPLFRKVVTDAYAAEIGLDVQEVSITEHDTRGATGSVRGSPTEGAYADQTQLNARGSTPAVAPQRSRWTIPVYAGIASALLAGGAYATVPSLLAEPLPAGYAEFLSAPGIGESGEVLAPLTAAKAARIEVVRLDPVRVVLYGSPPEAQVYLLGAQGEELLGTLAPPGLELERDRGDAALAIRVTAPGHVDQRLSIALDFDAKKLTKQVALVAVAPVPQPEGTPPPPPRRDPVARPDAPPRRDDPQPKPDPVVKADPPPKADPVVKADPPPKPPDPFVKVDGRKEPDDPFKKKGDIKVNPFQ